MMSPADIANLNIPYIFGSIDGCDISPEMEYVMDQVESDVTIVWGATKFVIVFDKEVVKIPFNGMYDYDSENDFNYFRTKDYCSIEAMIYDKAEDAGLEYFFAKTEYAGETVSNTPYYISERVYEWYESGTKSRKPSPENIEKAKTFYNSDDCHIWIDEKWFALAYEYYGEEEVKRLIKFIEENEISDFHGGNLGVREDGSPCIIDYSSFKEE